MSTSQMKRSRESACAARRNNCGDRAKQDRGVKFQRPLIDVVQIELHPLFERQVAAAGYLPQTSEARLDAETSFLPGDFHAQSVANRKRPRTDNAHFAEQNVDKLWQFIDARFAQQPTGACDARVILDLKDRA